MKKLLILLFLPLMVTAQKIEVDVLKKKHLTTAQRDLYVVPVGETWEIYNTTTGQKEKNVGGAGWVSDEGGAGSADGLGTARDVGPFTVVDADNATLDNDAVDTQHIALDAVTGDKIDQETVTSVNVQNFSLGYQELDTDIDATPTDEYLLAFESTGSTLKWVDPATVGSGGGNNSPVLTENNIGSAGTYTTGAGYEDVLNTPSGAGTYTINLAADASYDHPNGTILWFLIDEDATVTFQPDTGATAPTLTVVEGASPKFIKLADNTWKTLEYTKITEPVAGTISGRTGTTVTAVLQQTEAQYTTDGDPSAGEIVFCSDCAPMTDATASTLEVNNYKGYDDRATDAATFTFSNLKDGATVLIEIDRATDATYSGVTVTHTTGAFAANTRQLVTIFVLPSGDVLRDYKNLE